VVNKDEYKIKPFLLTAVHIHKEDHQYYKNENKINKKQ